jgi:pimeloyl-ACP methyl ester carboxylesterase
MRAAKATSLCAKAVASARARSKLAKRNTTNSSVMTTTTTTTATRCASSSSNSGRDDDEGVSFAVPGLEVFDHAFAVPLLHPTLNYASPTLTSTKTIQIFVREIVASANKAKDKRESLKTCLYLQGGPGFECARVQEIGGWIGHMAKEKNMRVLLLDQRGTGRSSPMTRQKLMREEISMHETLQYYRADSIVEDCEFVRKKMLGEEKKYDVVLGQSFGGFCLTTYLSRYGEEAIENALLTGGVPPLNNKDPKDSYVKLLERVKSR